MIYLLSSIVMIIIISLLIIISSWYYVEYSPIHRVNNDDDSDFDSSIMMMILSSKHNNEQRQINTSMKETRRRRHLSLSSFPLSSLLFSLSSSSSSSSSSTKGKRSLQSTGDPLKDNQLAVIGLASLPNKNVHIASIQNNNENLVHHKTSSSLPYRPEYSTMKTKTNRTIRYIEDSLCSGCRYEYTTTNNERNENTTTCWYEIELLLSFDDNNNMSIEEAAIVVSTLYPNHCQRCNPNSCTDNDKKYYRPDDLISNQYIEYARTHYLKSININDRYPINILTSNDNLKEFLSDSNNVWPNHEYYMEFNPSITYLPKHQIPEQLLNEGTENNNNDDNYYLASYRVSTGNQCFHWEEQALIWNSNFLLLTNNDYIGFAILDVDLNIVLETIVAIRDVIIPSISEMSWEHLYQDGRLYTLNNQLYLGSYTALYPIWLVPPNNTNNNNTTQSKEIVQMPYYMTAEHKVNKKYDENEYNNTNLLNVYIQRTGYCSNDKDYQINGKSYNYFYDNNQQRIVLETYPMGPKEYLDNDCQLSNNNIDMIIPNQSIPINYHYGTSDEITFSKYHQMKYPFSRDRGSYCCLSINDESSQQYYYPAYTNQTSILVGVSHIQSKEQFEPIHLNTNTYFHMFYAMESVEPYNIIARSGRFCLGYPKYDPNDNNTTNHNEIHFDNPRRREWKYRIGTEIYDCAKIHFVTGMIEALHDPTQIIISYGIDDCYSRFIMIRKEHILSLLFT